VSYDSENFPDLPQGWRKIAVGDAAAPVTVRDKIPTKAYVKAGALAVVDQGQALIGGYTNDQSIAVATSLPVVVFGDHTRALKFIDFPFAAGADGIKILRPSPAFLPRLFFHFLRAIRLPDRGYARHYQFLRDSQIPLPPLPEQTRIADKLDTLLARVDTCRNHLARVPAILKRFRQSVLTAATSGDLTSDWRNEHLRDASDWKVATAGDLIDRIEAGLNVQCIERPPTSSERGLVKISAVTWGRYNDDESKTLPTQMVVPDSARIKLGDFLISRANTLELVGACVIVDRVIRPVYLSDKVLRLVMQEPLKPWMLIVLRSAQGREQIESLASGNQLSMRNLSQANLRLINVPMPPADEQAEIVRRVDSLFALADQLEARYTTARTHIDRLTPALLAKAFRGELVPQDPGDSL